MDNGLKWDTELGRPYMFKDNNEEELENSGEFSEYSQNRSSSSTTKTTTNSSSSSSKSNNNNNNNSEVLISSQKQKKENLVRPIYSFGDSIGDRFVRQPRGHSVGIAGFGAIGKEIGSRLNAIGMKIHYTKRTKLTPSEESSLGYPVTFHDSVEHMLPFSDLLVLALPISPQTRHLLNDRTLALLPREARIVNIGRGGLIDTSALLRSLKSGRVAGAALDVFENEPIVEKDLCSRWDVILTPHIGSSTHENVLGAEKICMNNITNLFYGDGQSLTIVNEKFIKRN